MRKVIMMMSMLLSVGSFFACSSDDELSVLMDSKLELFEDSLRSIPENDYTGSLYFDSHYGWTIVPLGMYYDYPCEYYLPVNLPEKFKNTANKRESAKVAFSGKVIKMSDKEVESLNLWRYDGTESFYFVYLTKIEEIEESETPYRGDPPFTITDMPGMMVDFNNGTWYISYVNEDHFMANLYCPTELSDEFKVQGLNVIMSGNVYEEVDNPDSPSQKLYKIELTKIEKAE